MSAEARREASGVPSGAAALLAGYRPFPGVHDELMDAFGQIRPSWRPFLQALAEIGPAKLRERAELAERQLGLAGVSYHVYDGERGRDRAWPLSPIPLVVEADEWAEIAAGVAQRARLLEAVLADAYGPGELVRNGALPAAVIAGSPEFLRPVHGAKPAGGQFLTLYAADLARGADGRWWVLSDRTQAPSGAGYAVENRLAVSRAFPDLIGQLEVERLAGFFRALRTALAAGARRVEPRIGLLTPGPLNETYFEHAFLARYLGFLLVEGADLSVHNGKAYVGTVEGARRIDILLRRVDSLSCDPVELDTNSRLGVPGLVQAVRSGEVAIANALGSGVVEAPALLGFLPALAPRLLGEPLKLSNLATWWCGQARERADVLKSLDERVIAPAFAPRLSGRLDGAVHARELPPAARRKLTADIAARGLDFVGQEAVKLSTMPSFEDGRLVPRPFALRVFVALGPDGATVMPGGLARIAGSDDVSALSMQRGGRSADVWVLNERRTEHVSLLPREDGVKVRRGPGQLPSRAADHLFWLGRYLERAEATLRLAKAYLTREAEAHGFGTASAAKRISGLLAAWAGAKPGEHTGEEIVRRSLYEAAAPGSAPGLVGDALRAATTARDRLPPEAWRTLVQLDRDFRSGTGERDATDRAEQGLRRIAAVGGFVQENMTRGPAWCFLEIGRRIERGLVACRFARVFGGEDEALLDVLLDLADSQLAYRRRYLVGLARTPVVDLVVLDPANPRSAAFQVARIVESLSAVAPAGPHAPLPPLEAAALSLSTVLRTAAAGDVEAEWLMETENDLMALSDAVSSRYLIERPPVPNEPLLFT
jgi:uncharacterized circularly permuted ATP-grasp superfamily protein/uncharacterized alpha-E superfamily protein